MTRTLTELEARMLAFEEKWEGRSGSKEAAIRSEFGWRTVAYEQRLQQLLRDPAAEVVKPLLVHRLQRVRAEAARRRMLRLVG
jgi:hypothetical protein